MDIVSKYLELKEIKNKKKDILYNEGCDNLIKSIYLEYSKNQTILKNYVPEYKNGQRGLLFGLDFAMVLKNKSKTKSKTESKKKIIIEPNIVKTTYPELYLFVKNNFVKRIIHIDEYINFEDANKNLLELEQNIVKQFISRDLWITQLYKYYYHNNLLKLDETEYLQLCKLLAQSNNFITEPTKILESLYLFENFNVSIIFGFCYSIYFFNDKYLIKLTHNVSYPNGYRPKYICVIIDLHTKKEIIWIEDLGHDLRIWVDKMFEQIIEFIHTNCQIPLYLKK
jgi:hypothetical protein